MTDYQLETAYLDWSSVRIQMIAGMLAVFCLCWTDFFPTSRLLVPPGLGSPTCASGCPLLNGLQIITFIGYCSSCLLTALITLEITGRFGNRLGAGCAIWSAVLFAILNSTSTICSANEITDRAVSFFILLAIFLFLRSKENKSLVLWLLFLAFCFGLYLNSRFDSVPMALSFNQILFPQQIKTIGTFESYLLAGACLLSGANLLMRISLRTLDFQSISICFGSLLLAVILANFRIFDYEIWQKAGPAYTSLILARAAFAIAFSLCSLPGIDSSNLKICRLTSILGLIALLFMTVSLQRLFTS